MDKDPECIFCKIVDGEIPSYRIAESELCIAILDAFPVNHGHSLVITKRHSKDYFDMTPEEKQDAANLLNDVGKAIIKATGAPGMNLLSNVGPVAGQVVMHAHMHAIPRFEDDPMDVRFGKAPPQSDEEKAETLKSIKDNL